MDYDGYPEYPQLHRPFEHAVSDPRPAPPHRRRRAPSYMLRRERGRVSREPSSRARRAATTRQARRARPERRSGVDWNSTSRRSCASSSCSTSARGRGEPFSLIDYGCGYGALVGRPRRARERRLLHGLRRLGGDARAGARAARRRRPLPIRRATRDELEPADYTVASGDLQRQARRAEDDWRRVRARHDRPHWPRLSARGFAFNMLTALLRPASTCATTSTTATRCAFFDLCKRDYSRHVALLHDYGLWEFTILVRDWTAVGQLSRRGRHLRHAATSPASRASTSRRTARTRSSRSPSNERYIDRAELDGLPVVPFEELERAPPAASAARCSSRSGSARSTRRARDGVRAVQGARLRADHAT